MMGSLRWSVHICEDRVTIKFKFSRKKIRAWQRIRILFFINSALRKGFLKTWRIIINCQNVLQWQCTVTQLLCSIIILSISELSQPTHCRLEWQFSQLMHCSVKDTVAPIHRIIASIVVFDKFFFWQITISFLLEENLFAGKTAPFCDNVFGPLSVFSDFYVELVLMKAFRFSSKNVHNFHEILILNLLHIYSGYVSFKKISLHISREWASIHFFATRPDSHSTISIIAWYL